MSLHDVCVFIPSWFGVVSTIFLGLLTYECTRCVDSSVSGSCNKGVEMEGKEQKEVRKLRDAVSFQSNVLLMCFSWAFQRFLLGNSWLYVVV